MVVRRSRLTVVVVVEQVVCPGLDTEAAHGVELGVVEVVLRLVAGGGQLRPALLLNGGMVELGVTLGDLAAVVVPGQEVADDQPVSQRFVLAETLLLHIPRLTALLVGPGCGGAGRGGPGGR